MSLINNLLKDIEKRETRIHSLPYISLINTPRQRRMSFSPTWFVGAAATSFVILMIIYMLSGHTTVKKLPSFVNTTSSNEANNSPVDPIYLQPTTIAGITLQAKPQMTEIGLLLNHAALYRIISHDNRNEVSLIVDHAQLQSELPSFNYANSAIERITSDTINGTDTRIDIYLLPGAELNYVNQNTDHNNAQILLGITAPVEHSVPAQQTSNLASKPNLIKIPDANSLVMQQYQEALETAQKGNYASALQQLETIVQAEPGYKDARVSLAALLLDQGYADKAKLIVDQGLAITPSYAPLIELKARLMTLDGKLKQALTYLEMNPPPIADNPQYHAFIAALYEQTNQYLSAFKLYKQLLQLDSSNSSWWMGLGISLEKLKQPKSAISAYAKAMQVGSLDASSVSYLQDRLQALREDTNEKG